MAATGDVVREPERGAHGDGSGRVRLCCYLSSEEFGGMEITLATLLGALPARFEVTLLGSAIEVLAKVADARPDTEIQLVPPVRGKWDVGAIAAQIRALRRMRPDLLHASMGHLYQAQYTLFAAVLTGTPAVAVVHGVFPQPPRSTDVLFGRLMRRVRVAGVSHYVCRNIESEFRLPPGTALLLYNGVEDAVAEPPPVWRSGDGALILGAVGRCVPEKGFDVLLRSLVDLPDCRLVLLGDGAGRTELVRLADRLGVADRVRFVGWVDQPWTSRWNFDVLVAPSRTEGFGMAVVEAMQVGIPVVASRVGGLDELIDDGTTGILVEPDDAAALAAAIAKLAADPDGHRLMAERARAAIAHRFDTRAMCRAYVAVFDDALGGAHRP